MHVHRFSDPETLAQGAATWLCSRAATSDGVFRVALSGGSTPRRLYSLLSGHPFRDTMPWDRIHWYWGDERFVPHDHPDSNYKMAREALFDLVPVPEANIHPVATQLATPEMAAERYERDIAALRKDLGQGDRPFFDLVLLGVGDDGHTASLFPGTSTLAVRDHWVQSVIGARSEPRITLTFPALQASRNVAFLATGGAKRDIIGAIWSEADFPAARVTSDGDIHRFVDKAAASVDDRTASRA